MGNVSLAMRRGNILAHGDARKCADKTARRARRLVFEYKSDLRFGSITKGRNCMRFISLVAIALATCVGIALAQDAATQAGTVSDETFDAALTKAAAAEPGSADFVSALQSVAARFAVVEPATQPASGAWHDLPLNTRGKKVDTFRLRVPDGEKRDLFWALAFPKSMDRWY